MNRPLTVGTAGHIDHGKTALVRALTGHDTDRLAEEKRRGISIELGFAPLDLGRRRLSLIDVPGHERFVRTMIGGASGIDMFLMVVAADDGVMPQTHEHATVMRALGIEHGVVALTKCDVADLNARGQAASQVQELIPGTPVVEVSAKTGDGIEELRAALDSASVQVERDPPAPRDAGEAVLHIDRVFTITGRGTVVTGTLWSGSVGRGDQLKLLPAGTTTRVREVQVHDQAVAFAEAHQRVALNLVGVDRDEVERGDVLASTRSALAPTYRLDVQFGVASEELRDRERVQVHHGTREAPGKVVRLADDLAQLRLEAPLVAAAGDRFVLRRIAPPETLGGGRVLDAHPGRHGPGSRVERRRPIQKGARRRPKKTVEPTLTPTALTLQILEVMRSDGTMPRGPEALAEVLGIEASEAIAGLDRLTATGELVRVKPGIYYPCGQLSHLREVVVTLIQARGPVTLAEARDALGLSRKYTQALLEHLDACHVTIRRGERRGLRRRPLGTADADR